MSITKYEGSRSPSLPQIDKDPLRTLSKMALEMEFSNLLHVLLLRKKALGGMSESKLLLLNMPLKG